MKRMNPKYILGMAFVVAVAASCSIKENRVPCPAYLKVYFADRENLEGKSVYLAGIASGQTLFAQPVAVSEADPCWVRAVRKDIIRVGACFSPGLLGRGGLHAG